MDLTFTYTSQLPAMFQSVEANAFAHMNGTVMEKKAVLWKHILACKDRIKLDPNYNTAPVAIQQYQLEVWAHEMYCKFFIFSCSPIFAYNQ